MKYKAVQINKREFSQDREAKMSKMDSFRSQPGTYVVPGLKERHHAAGLSAPLGRRPRNHKPHTVGSN